MCLMAPGQVIAIDGPMVMVAVSGRRRAASILADVAQLPAAELGAYAARTIPAPFRSKACAAPVREAADERNPS